MLSRICPSGRPLSDSREAEPMHQLALVLAYCCLPRGFIAGHSLMMQKVRICFLVCALFVFFPSSPIFPQTRFDYIHNKGDIWHLTSIIDLEVLANGKYNSSSQIRNKISVEIVEGEGGDGSLRARHQISEKVAGSDVYSWSEDYEVEYQRDIRGHVSGIKAESPVPMTRNIPVYPDGPVSPGAEWTADGSEVLNLGRLFFQADMLLEIPFVANYRYLGSLERDERQMEKVSINCSYRWIPNSDTLEIFNAYAWFPVELVGTFWQEVLWDASAGRNYAETGSFEYTYIMNDGMELTFRGASRGQALYSAPLDKNSIIKEIEELASDDIRASSIDGGLSISLENIHFVPDEARMLSGEEKKLEGIARVLERYPDRDILVIGHTARPPGSSGGWKLSYQRAQAVARFLIEGGVRANSQVVIRGMGNSQPIGDNSTEEGRRKNRRVEIVILEN